MELCKACHGGCCRRYNPYLWGSDIIRICDALKVDMHFFATVVKVDESKVEKFRGKEAMFKFADISENDYFVFVLNLNESKYYPGTSKCMFLQEWYADILGSEELTGVIGRCGIYSIRPINCRAWPAKYVEEEKRVIIRDPHLILENEHNKIEDNDVYKICPRPLNKEDYSIYQDQYVADAMSNFAERQFFIQISEKWNKNPGTSNEFYDFMVKEYDNRIEYIKEQK